MLECKRRVVLEYITQSWNKNRSDWQKKNACEVAILHRKREAADMRRGLTTGGYVTERLDDFAMIY